MFLTRSNVLVNRVTQLLGLSLIPQPDILPLNDYKELSKLHSITAFAFLQAHRLGSSRSLSLVAVATPLVPHGSGRVLSEGLNTECIWGAPILTLVLAIATNTKG